MKYAACLLLCGMLAFAAVEPASAIFDRAVQALAASNYPAAEQGFQSVLRQQPNNVGAIGNLGILYARTDRSSQAIGYYKRALRLSPNDEPILLNLGIVYLKQDHHDLALPYFRRVTAIDPHNLQARQLLDVCRIYTGEATAAIGDLKELSASNSRDQQLLFLLGFAYLKSGDTKTAQTVFNQMFEVAGPAQAQFLFGKAAYEAALFQQAEESYLEVLKIDPAFPELHLQLGKLYISQRRNEDAVRELETALKQNPTSEEASYFLGSLLIQENRYDEGIAYLEQSIKLKPDSWAAYLYLGRAQLHLQKTASAVAMLKKAAELNSDDASVQYQLGRALQADGQKAAAATAFAKARSLNAGALNEAAIPGVR